MLRAIDERVTEYVSDLHSEAERVKKAVKDPLFLIKDFYLGSGSVKQRKIHSVLFDGVKVQQKDFREQALINLNKFCRNIDDSVMCECRSSPTGHYILKFDGVSILRFNIMKKVFSDARIFESEEQLSGTIKDLKNKINSLECDLNKKRNWRKAPLKHLILGNNQYLKNPFVYIKNQLRDTYIGVFKRVWVIERLNQIIKNDEIFIQQLESQIKDYEDRIVYLRNNKPLWEEKYFFWSQEFKKLGYEEVDKRSSLVY
ncbi:MULTISPECIES: hypothetical protein [Bacillus subtilis group]|nr:MULTISPECIES: hypothetical protein [Bacillus subtilis group]MBT3123204.1 hypothetical protein [Bacillus inaquosorum]MCB4340524.1 hypothetical protein [Bacillus subtilis]MCB5337339.1 hypothetical protein [Bacillus amyloliquefaciens]MCF7615379.1 hypothetical protein [Bacillus subtilis]QWK35306.1 hypothetical protein KM843_20585 [Bacillus velezensis]